LYYKIFLCLFRNNLNKKEAEVAIILKKQEGAMPVTGTAPSLSYLLALIG
jgi:hypothetical protein